MNLILVILVGMVAILAVAYFKPEWFKNVYETYLKDTWIIVVGFIAEVWTWLSTDPSWQAVLPPKYMPWAIMGMGILGILLRRINTPKE